VKPEPVKARRARGKSAEPIESRQLPQPENRVPDPVLGLDMAGITELTVAEIQASEAALKMLLHYYNQIRSENEQIKEQNEALRTEINSLRTYQVFYTIMRERKNNAAVMLTISPILIGFGTNLLTQEIAVQGILTFGGGLASLGGGLFQLLKEKLPNEQ
jgi:hypothetical protein